MADSRFFKCNGPFKAHELADIASAELVGDKDALITDVASIDQATSEQVSFLDNRKYVKAFTKSKAGLCLVHPEVADKAPEGMSLLVTAEPYMGYAKIASTFYPVTFPKAKISERANISETATIADGVIIEAGAYVGENVIIGKGTWIKSNAVLGDGVTVGENCIIHPNVTLSHTIISNGVTIHPGCQIGQDGFGFASGAQGHVRIPQLGRVLIGDHVNIGAATTIDRGAGPDTVIGAGTQIDNIVQIGHNVQIGMGCVIVSHVGISGSTKLGNFVVVGGQAGVAGHLEIGDSVVIAAKAGVMRNVEAGQTVGGFPAIPQWKWLRQVGMIEKLTRGKK
ncbi:UDP-3-O-acylglucosamine N-acyltransferase [Candidatus Terasakiella magnetica]|uniref:UDP-3-O-acylglucosamine N-acyltransferase n=1 Tax=Candidatus Terasakiella magnetica TaxID=1867952 RepID=A0A1C3RCN2_9PROT|nr:UDP-3-O-(3-hydroxymyristoyl)glucosamine N-acyltransferase [Candidatus Terasakiella magnetica]SCA55030.1 UDP-3-O-acylglucosamine N-acyltransferase [Candidatus Terasakiella magnetica]